MPGLASRILGYLVSVMLLLMIGVWAVHAAWLMGLPGVQPR